MPHYHGAHKNKVAAPSCTDVDVIEDSCDDSFEAIGEARLDPCAWPPGSPPGEPDARTSASTPTAANEVPAKVESAARRFETMGHWDSESGDLAPVMLTLLPGWQASGVGLQIEEAGRPTLRYPDNFSNPSSVITLRRCGSHYVPLVNGREVDQGADGNCLFYSIWYALEQSVPTATRRVLYEGDLPLNKVSGTCYFRAAGARYIRQHHASIAGFLIDEVPPSRILDDDEWYDALDEAQLAEISDNEVWHDALERFKEHEPFSSMPTLDKPADVISGASRSSPFALTEIASACIVLAGDFATQALFRFGTSAVLTVAPSWLADLWTAYLVDGAIGSLLHGALVDGFLDLILATEFEWLAPGSLIAEIAEIALVFLREQAPWLLAALNAIGVSPDMNLVNTLALSLVAAIYHLFIKGKISISRGSHARSLIKLVAHLRKISFVYRSIERRIIGQRSVVTELPRIAKLIDTPSKNSSLPADSEAGIFSDRDYAWYESSKDAAVEPTEGQCELHLNDAIDTAATEHELHANTTADATYTVQNLNHYRGAQSTSPGRRAETTPFLVGAAAVGGGVVAIVGGAAFSLCEYIAYIHIAYGKRVWPTTIFLGIGGFFFYLIYNTPGPVPENSFHDTFQELVSTGLAADFDPVPWNTNTLSKAEYPGKEENSRLRRHLMAYEGETDTVSDPQLWTYEESISPRHNSSLSENDLSQIKIALDGLYKASINRTTFDFFESSSFNPAYFYKYSARDGRTYEAVWQDFAEYLIQQQINSNITTKPLAFKGFSAYIFSSKNNKENPEWPILNGLIRDSSSQSIYGKSLWNALKSNNTPRLNEIMFKVCVFEVFRSKILGHNRDFPYLEPIFGLEQPQIHINHLPLILSSIDELQWGSTNENDPISRGVRSGTDMYIAAYQTHFPDFHGNAEDILKIISDDQSPFSVSLYTIQKILEQQEEKLRRIAYVKDATARDISEDLLQTITAHYTLVLNTFYTEKYLEFLSRLFENSEATNIISQYTDTYEYHDPYISINKCSAISAKIYRALHPPRTGWTSITTTAEDPLELFEKTVNEGNSRDIEDIEFGRLACTLRSLEMSTESLLTQAPNTFTNLKFIASALQTNPIISRIMNSNADLALACLKETSPNDQIGDSKFFQQFEKCKKLLPDLVTQIGSLLLADTLPKITALYGLRIDEISAYKLYGDQGPDHTYRFTGIGESDFAEILALPGEQKNIREDRIPGGLIEILPGELIVIKTGSEAERALIIISTLMEQLAIRYFNKFDVTTGSEALRYLATKTNSQLEIDARRNRPVGDGSGHVMPKGTSKSLYGSRLGDLMCNLYKNSKCAGISIGNIPIYLSYLVFDQEETADYRRLSFFQATDKPLLASLTRCLINYKYNIYLTPLWQKITAILPLVNSIYHEHMDPDYKLDPNALLFDVISLASAFRTVTSSSRLLYHFAKQKLYRGITAKISLKFGKISAEKAISESRKLGTWFIPTALVPFTLHTSLGSIQKMVRTFRIKLDYGALIVHNPSGSIAWIDTFNNWFFLLNIGSLAQTWGAPSSSGEVIEEQIQNYLEAVAAGNLHTHSASILSSLMNTRAAKLLSRDLDRVTIAKYQYVNCQDFAQSPRYAAIVYMKNGDTCVFDTNFGRSQRLTMSKPAWISKIKSSSSATRLRRGEFSSMAEARKSELHDDAITSLGRSKKRGQIFNYDKIKYYKTGLRETCLSLSEKFYNTTSTASLLCSEATNPHIQEHILPRFNLPCNLVLRIPYLKSEYFSDLKSTGIIFSDMRLPIGLDYNNWTILGEYGRGRSVDKLATGLPENPSDHLLKNGDRYIKDGAQWYRTKEFDDLSHISHKFYNSDIFSKILIDINPGISDNNHTVMARTDIRAPFAFWISRYPVNHMTAGDDYFYLRVIKHSSMNANGVISAPKYALGFMNKSGYEYSIIDENFPESKKIPMSITQWKTESEEIVETSKPSSIFFRFGIFRDMGAAKEANLFALLPKSFDLFSSHIREGHYFQFGGKRYYKTKSSDTLADIANKYYGQNFDWRFLSRLSENYEALKNSKMTFRFASDYYFNEPAYEFPQGTLIYIPRVDYLLIQNLNKTIILSDFKLKNSLRLDMFDSQNIFGTLPREIDGNNLVSTCDYGVFVNQDDGRFYLIGENEVFQDVILKTYGKNILNDYKSWEEMLYSWGENLRFRAINGTLPVGEKIHLPYPYESITRTDAQHLQATPTYQKIALYAAEAASGSLFEYEGQQFYVTKKDDTLHELSKNNYDYDSAWTYLKYSMFNGVLFADIKSDQKLKERTIISLPRLDWFFGRYSSKGIIFCDVMPSDYFSFDGWLTNYPLPSSLPLEFEENILTNLEGGMIPEGKIFTRNGVRFYKAAKGDSMMSILEKIYNIAFRDDDFTLWQFKLARWGININYSSREPNAGELVALPYAFVVPPKEAAPTKGPASQFDFKTICSKNPFFHPLCPKL